MRKQNNALSLIQVGDGDDEDDGVDEPTRGRSFSEICSLVSHLERGAHSPTNLRTAYVTLSDSWEKETTHEY